MDNIAQHVASCLRGFKALCSALEGKEAEQGVLKNARRLLPLPRAVAELSRFKVWSANIGAHGKGRSSLDYRLREASNIRGQVVNLLQDLDYLLTDARAIISGDRSPLEALQQSEDDEDDDGDELELALDLEPPQPELSQILAGIVEDINCLLRLSLSIRNPAPHDRFKKLSSIVVSHFEPFDAQHVRNKFSETSAGVIERLGKGISRRRQYLRYRQLHHQKLASGLEDDGGDPAESGDDVAMQSTVASSIPDHMKDGHGQGVALFHERRDDASDSGQSRTSYATSGTELDRPVFPRMPEGAREGPFECPFCFTMIRASDRYLWKKHVYADLTPYICLSPDCPDPDHDFERRHQWANHVRKYHWKTWTCILGCSHEFTSAMEMNNHLQGSHGADPNSAQLEGLLSACERPKPITDAGACPLCHELLVGFQSYKRHVGRHLEDLALFALPQAFHEGNQQQDDEVDSILDEESDEPGEDVEDIVPGDELLSSTGSLQDPVDWDVAANTSGVSGKTTAPHVLDYLRDLEAIRGEPQLYETGVPNKERSAELKKHIRRHIRPYFCTFSGCGKRFGSKNDWMRHESSNHFLPEVWTCDETGCAKVYIRAAAFRRHLREQHQFADPNAQQARLEKCRMGRDSDPRFWCGFCLKVVEIEDAGTNSWVYRCDHIDAHLFGREGLPKQLGSEWKQQVDHEETI